MKIKVKKRKSVAEAVAVKREMTLDELFKENDKLIQQLDDQFNDILAEIKVIQRIMEDKNRRAENE